MSPPIRVLAFSGLILPITLGARKTQKLLDNFAKFLKEQRALLQDIEK